MGKHKKHKKDHNCKKCRLDKKENKTEDNTEDCCPEEKATAPKTTTTGLSLKSIAPTIILVVLFTVMLAVTMRFVCEWMGIPI